MESEISNPALVVPAETKGRAAFTECRPFATAACLAALDILSVPLAVSLASVLRDFVFGDHASPIYITILPALVMVMCTFAVAGLYPGVSMNPVDEFRICTFSTTIAFLSLIAGTFFLHDLSQSRVVYVLAYIFTVLLVPFFRTWARSVFSKKSWWGTPVAIVGYGVTGKLVVSKLLASPHIGLKPVAIFEDDATQYKDVEAQLVCRPISECLDVAREHKITYGIVCMPNVSREKLFELLECYRGCFRHFVIIPNLIGMSSLGTCAREIGGIVGLEVTQHLLRPSARFMKRLLDLSVTILVAPFVVPLVGLFAILTKLEGKGPILFANERIGHHGLPFKAWKLRSMVTNGDEVLHRYLEQHPDENAYWQTTQKLKRDPRITRIGRIIRKTSIDELPQLWNVLVGEMSLVGPRPILEKQIPMYGESFNLYKQVRPGLTGLWQISGRNQLTFAERVTLDKYVIENWSVWLDFYILVRTVKAVLSGDGAY